MTIVLFPNRNLADYDESTEIISEVVNKGDKDNPRYERVILAKKAKFGVDTFPARVKDVMAFANTYILEDGTKPFVSKTEVELYEMLVRDFHNKAFALTDYPGKFEEQNKAIGFVDYSKNRGIFTFDQVQYLYRAGLTKNVFLKVENDEVIPQLEETNLSNVQPITIVCGIPFFSEPHENLIAYARKVGWVHEEPIPIKMHTCTKTMQDNKDDTYDVTFAFEKTFFNNENDVELLKKIAVGTIQKLRNKMWTLQLDEGGDEKNPYIVCEEILFDREMLSLTVRKIPSEYFRSREIRDAFIELDLEIWILFSKNNPYNIMCAAISAMQDRNVAHMMENESFYGVARINPKSNVYWFEQSNEE